MKKEVVLTTREKKFARTRYGLLGVFMAHIRAGNESELSIEDYCEEIGISRGTFFNYFPSREHLFTYYAYYFSARLWIELAKKRERGMTVKEELAFVFEYTTKENQIYSNSFGKYISHILRRKENTREALSFTRADLYYIFPDEARRILEDPLLKHPKSEKEDLAMNDILMIPSIGEVFSLLLQEGMKRGEIKEDLNVKEFIVKLLAVYFAPPTVGRFLYEGDRVGEIYGILLPDVLDKL